MKETKWFKNGHGTYTPWGRAQCSEKYATGIVSYSTTGHGGFHLSDGMLAKMPENIRNWWSGQSHYGQSENWFEEDCEWAVVALAFPMCFTAFEVECATKTIKVYYPSFIW